MTHNLKRKAEENSDVGQGQAGHEKRPRLDPKETVREYLQQFSIESFLIRESKSILIHQDASIAVALVELSTRGLHWAPVTDGKFVLGTIGFNQIVRFIVKTLKSSEKVEGNFDFAEDVFHALLSEEKLSETSVKDIINAFDNTNDAKIGKAVLDINTPLVHAIDLMSYGQHRFVVVKENEFHGLLSHSDIVSHLAQHVDVLGPIVEKTISEVSVGLETVVRIKNESKVLEAFEGLAHWNINGIAVLGHGGVLVGNISSTDLRIIVDGGKLNMTALYLNADDFLRQVRQKSIMRVSNVVCVREYETIGNLLRIFASNKVQRVYVVDSNGRLTGVITIRDLLMKLVPPHVPPRGNTSPRHSSPDDDEKHVSY